MQTARIVVDLMTSEASVFSPYEVRAVMRSIPGRRWSKSGKCWVIPMREVDLCADALRQFGIRVMLAGDAPKTGPHGRRDKPAPDWVEAAFAAVAEDKIDKLRRGLMSAFHPDLGGDPAIAQRINSAADKRLARR